MNSSTDQGRNPLEIENIQTERVIDNNKKIKILSYNIFMRPPFINNNGDDFKNERLDLILERIGDYDIVNFQELFKLMNGRKQKMRKESFKRGFKHSAIPQDPGCCSCFLVDSGLMTISTYQIVDSRFYLFKNSKGVDGFASKGLHFTRIKVGDKIINLGNLHLQASYSGQYNDENKGYYQARLEQICELRNFINQHVKNCQKMRMSEQQGGKGAEGRGLSRSGSGGALLKSKIYSNLPKVEDNELFLLMGDFNVNGLPKVQLPNNFKLKDKEAREWVENQDGGFDEYDFLVWNLGNRGEGKVVDLIKESNGGSSVVTFADSYINEEGEEVPKETVLSDKSDLKSKQALDHIFQILPFKNEENKVFNFQGKAEPFFLDHKVSETQKLTQLSDHYGVSIEFEFPNKAIKAVKNVI